MTALLSDLPLVTAARTPERIALRLRSEQLTYGELAAAIEASASGFRALGLARQGRVAVYLNKRFETVASCFGAARAGGAFVPVNPLLKAPQVAHILRDCAASVLVTAAERIADLESIFDALPTLDHLVVVGSPGPSNSHGPARHEFSRGDHGRGLDRRNARRDGTFCHGVRP